MSRDSNRWFPGETKDIEAVVMCYVYNFINEKCLKCLTTFDLDVMCQG